MHVEIPKGCNMFSGKSLLVGLAATFVTLATTASIHAGVTENRTTFLTFNRPVALPGVSLGSGTYIFEMADPIGANGAVRVLSRDRRIVYLTAFTDEVSRPHDMPRGQHVSFGEAAPDRPVPIYIWWSDDSVGRKFIYR
jgi:hypothetical protein